MPLARLTSAWVSRGRANEGAKEDFLPGQRKTKTRETASNWNGGAGPRDWEVGGKSFLLQSFEIQWVREGL